MNTVLEVFVPRQFDPSTEKLVETAVVSAESSSTALLGSNFIINLMVRGSLNQVWSMLNSLQIVTHVPLMDLKMPANMSAFLAFLMEVATFDLLPREAMI